MSTVDEMLAQARAAAEPSAEVRARVGWALKSTLANPPPPLAPGPTMTPARTSLGGGSLGSYLTVAAIAAGLGFGAGLGTTRLFPPSASSQSTSLSAQEQQLEAPGTSPGTPQAADARALQIEAHASGDANTSTSRASENTRAEHRTPSDQSTTSKDAVAAQAPESGAAPQDQLLFVVAGLQRAQTALKNDHPVQALLLLDELDANYPSEVLSEERSAVRVHAQCAAGHSPTSLVAARSFVRTYPTSLYVTRIRKACGIDDEPQEKLTPTE